jgi:hypothetical protein
MNCDQYQEKLNAFFDGERTDALIGDAFAHLYGCPVCQTFWREIIDFRNMAVNDSIPYPAGIDRSIYGLQRRKKSAPSFEFHLRMPRFAFGTVAALLLIIAFAAGYIISDKRSDGMVPVQMPEYALPARVVYVYTIPGATVYANEEIHNGPRELKPAIQHNAIY